MKLHLEIPRSAHSRMDEATAAAAAFETSTARGSSSSSSGFRVYCFKTMIVSVKMTSKIEGAEIEEEKLLSLRPEQADHFLSTLNHNRCLSVWAANNRPY